MISLNLSAWIASYCPRITSGLIFTVIPFCGILAMTVMFQPGVQALTALGSIWGVVPMEITFMDNGGNIFVLDEFIGQMYSYT
jgi:hypothetical protein